MADVSWWTSNAPPNFNRYGNEVMLPNQPGAQASTAWHIDPQTGQRVEGPGEGPQRQTSDPNAPGYDPGSGPLPPPGGWKPGDIQPIPPAGGAGTPGTPIMGPGAPELSPEERAARARAWGGPSGQAPPPVAGTPSATSADDFGGPQNGDYQAWFQKLIQGKPYNQQTLLAIEPILQQYGIQLTPPNAAGERTKINIPGQGWVRVGFGEGKPVWIPQGGGGGGGGTQIASGAGLMQNAGGRRGFDPSMAGGIEPYQAPPFTAPSGLTEANDPGFHERMAMGAEGIENAAAARGGILSGGTLKALERYSQDYASNEYGNVFGRALTTAGYNAGQGQQGYTNRYGQYQDWMNWAQRNQDRGQRAGESAGRPPPA